MSRKELLSRLEDLDYDHMRAWTDWQYSGGGKKESTLLDVIVNEYRAIEALLYGEPKSFLYGVAKVEG